MRKDLKRFLVVVAAMAMSFPASVAADVISLDPRPDPVPVTSVVEGFAPGFVLVALLAAVTAGLIRMIWGGRYGDGFRYGPGRDMDGDDALRLKDEEDGADG